MTETAVVVNEDGSGTYLSSVHKLLGFIVIDAVYFQKWVWLTEEILRRKQSIETSGPNSWSWWQISKSNELSVSSGKRKRDKWIHVLFLLFQLYLFRKSHWDLFDKRQIRADERWTTSRMTLRFRLSLIYSFMNQRIFNVMNFSRAKLQESITKKFRMLFQYGSYFFSTYLDWLSFRRFVWQETEVRTNGCWQWFIMVCAEKEVIVSLIKGQGEAGIKFTAQHGGCFIGDIIHEVKYERGEKKDVISSFSCANSLLYKYLY